MASIQLQSREVPGDLLQPTPVAAGSESSVRLSTGMVPKPSDMWGRAIAATISNSNGLSADITSDRVRSAVSSVTRNALAPAVDDPDTLVSACVDTQAPTKRRCAAAPAR